MTRTGQHDLQQGSGCLRTIPFLLLTITTLPLVANFLVQFSGFFIFFYFYISLKVKLNYGNIFFYQVSYFYDITITNITLLLIE